MSGFESETPEAPSGKRRSMIPALVLALVGLAGAGAAALYFLDVFPERERPPGGNVPAADPTEQSDISDAPAPAEAVAPSAAPAPAPVDAAAEAWAHTSHDDAVALRAFLSEHGDSDFAPAAGAQLQDLERRAWDEIASAGGVLAKLSAIEAYAEVFPGGEHLDAVRAQEASARSTLAVAQVRLSEAGFDAGRDGTVTPQTHEAIAAFQKAALLRQTGDLDEATLKALQDWSAPSPPEDTATPLEAASAVAVPGDSPAAETDAAPEPAPWVPRPFRDCPACPEMMRLPEGKFLMGDLNGDGDADEQPAHPVTIGRPIAIGLREVTFDEWDACVADGACTYRPDDNKWGRGARPVINISFTDAQAYLAWLSRKTGQAYRLPSEAEWEYAARAGTFDAYAGHDAGSLCEYGNGADAGSAYRWRNAQCDDGYADRPAPAGTFAPNAFGLYDMMGNVWEWVEDCWHDGYGGAPPDGSAWTADCEKDEHILRGGAFSVDIAKLRVSYRYSFADRQMPFFGFRVVRDSFENVGAAQAGETRLQ